MLKAKTQKGANYSVAEASATTSDVSKRTSDGGLLPYYGGDSYRRHLNLQHIKIRSPRAYTLGLYIRSKTKTITRTKKHPNVGTNQGQEALESRHSISRKPETTRQREITTTKETHHC